MSESTVRHRINKALQSLDAVAIENKLGDGTPDVNFVGGWLELKQRPSWPVKPGTIVRVPHYTQQQRRWAIRRHEKGGYCGTLIKVGRDWLLFHTQAPYILGRVDKERLLKEADRVWIGGLNDKELLDEVCRNLEQTKQSTS